MFESTNSIAPHVKAGRVRALAVTGERRAISLPDVPTLIEAGVPGYEVNAWSGVITTAGVPRPMLDKLNAAVNRAILRPDDEGAPRAARQRGRRRHARGVRRADPARFGQVGRGREALRRKDRLDRGVLMQRLALFALIFASSSAMAQAPQRVRGTITGLDGDVLSVKSRDGKDLKVHLTSDAQIATTKKGTMADFKPGSYVGVTSVKGPDGRLVARRVHALGPQVPQMHGAWDSIPDSMMTNSNIESSAQAVACTSPRSGTRTARRRLVPADRVLHVRPGHPCRSQAGRDDFHRRAQEGGKLIAQRVTVSKDGVKPPQ